MAGAPRSAAQAAVALARASRRMLERAALRARGLRVARHREPAALGPLSQVMAQGPASASLHHVSEPIHHARPRRTTGSGTRTLAVSGVAAGLPNRWSTETARMVHATRAFGEAAIRGVARSPLRGTVRASRLAQRGPGAVFEQAGPGSAGPGASNVSPVQTSRGPTAVLQSQGILPRSASAPGAGSREETPASRRVSRLLGRLATLVHRTTSVVERPPSGAGAPRRAISRPSGARPGAVEGATGPRARESAPRRGRPPVEPDLTALRQDVLATVMRELETLRWRGEDPDGQWF